MKLAEKLSSSSKGVTVAAQAQTDLKNLGASYSNFKIKYEAKHDDLAKKHITFQNTNQVLNYFSDVNSSVTAIDNTINDLKKLEPQLQSGPQKNPSLLSEIQKMITQVTNDVNQFESMLKTTIQNVNRVVTKQNTAAQESASAKATAQAAADFAKKKPKISPNVATKSTASESDPAMKKVTAAGKIGTAKTVSQVVNVCTSAFLSAIPPSFCYKKGADAGMIPTDCPSNYHRHGAMCYQNCNSGYYFNPVGYCSEYCPSGMTDMGLTCYRWWTPWTKTKSSYIPHILTNFDVPCPSGYYKGAALCYKDCGRWGMNNCGIGACALSSDACAQGIIDIVLNVVIGIAQLATFVLSFGASSADTPLMDGLKSAASKVGNKAAAMIFKGLKSSIFGFGKNAFLSRVSKKVAQIAQKDIVSKGLKWVQNKAVNSVASVITTQAVQNFCQTISNSLIQKHQQQSSANTSFKVSSLEPTGVYNAVTTCEQVNSSDVNSQLSCAKSVVNSASTFDPTGVTTIASALMQPVCDIDDY